jgi:hypothetical protein
MALDLLLIWIDGQDPELTKDRSLPVAEGRERPVAPTTLPAQAPRTAIARVIAAGGAGERAGGDGRFAHSPRSTPAITTGTAEARSSAAPRRSRPLQPARSGGIPLPRSVHPLRGTAASSWRRNWRW